MDNHYINSKITSSVKLRRMLAWTLDWTLSVLIGLLAGYILSEISLPKYTAVVIALVIFPSIILFMAFRDLVFNGKSLGKRLWHLTVVDRTTGKAPTRKQCALRGFLIPLYFIDGIILLASGYSIGDHIAGTAVLSDSDAQTLAEEAETIRSTDAPTLYNANNGGYVLNGEHIDSRGNTANKSSAGNKKRLLVTVMSVLLIIVIFISVVVYIVQSSLNTVKKSEQYAVAYDYLISSSFFKAAQADENEISLNGYRYSYSSEKEDAEFSFKVGVKQVKVYCHRENGKWIACEECSRLGGEAGAEINEISASRSPEGLTAKGGTV